MDFVPRPGQKEVLEYQGGKLAVAAVPGAGKTTVLAHLAAKLIAEELEDDKKILIVTYMNSAVANFRKKIGDFLAAQGLPRSRGYSVKTLHSLALNIIREKPEARLINQDFELIESGQKHAWIRELCSRWSAKNRDRMLDFFADNKSRYKTEQYIDKWKNKDFPSFVSAMIKRFKVKMLNSEELLNMIKYSKLKKKSILAAAAEIYADYELRLAQSGLLDFEDLVLNLNRHHIHKNRQINDKSLRKIHLLSKL